MSETKSSDGDGGDNARLTLKAPRRIVLRKTVEGGSIKQNFSHGRSKSVVVEVRKKKTFVKSAANENETHGIVQEERGGLQKGAMPRDNSVLVASDVAQKDRKQHILTPMTQQERVTFHEVQEQEREREREREREQERENERVRLEQEAKQRQEQEQLRLRQEAERLAAEKAKSEPKSERIAPPAPPIVETPKPKVETTPPPEPSVVQAPVSSPPPPPPLVVTAKKPEIPAAPPTASAPKSAVVAVKPVARPPTAATPPSQSTPTRNASPTAVAAKPAPAKEAVPKNLTRAQREELARKKTEILVAKRLTQLPELREQKRKLDERRPPPGPGPSSGSGPSAGGGSNKPSSENGTPGRETLKTKLKRKGKKSAVTDVQEKQLPVRKLGVKPALRRAGRFDIQSQQPIMRDVIIPEVITVGELASRMAIKSSEVIKRLMAQGMMVTINQVLDQDTAVLVVEELGHRPKTISEGAAIEAELADSNDLDKDLTIRAPVVTIMGHVDHGKTSLLDAIRKTDVAAREFGGITQHIGAYQVAMESGLSITFLDTPGHAAFTAMRARGAKVTDIVVLVVAADDGVMPQTIEALNHAKAANVPILVAINKIDRPNANPDRVMQQLADHGLLPEAWGGDSIFLNVSAKAGIGIESLKEMILLQAEVLNLRANFGKKARGYIIEAKLDKGRGAVATCLVANGVLRVGDFFVVGAEWGKIRGLLNDKGVPVLEALPAMPVEVIGLSGVPAAGDDLITVPDERRAKEIAAFRMRKNKEMEMAKQSPAKMDDLFDQIKQGEMDEVKVVIKADVQGSLEAVAEALLRITHEKVRVNIIHTAVGGINESDVMLAVASHALVIGFNVRADAKARDLVKRERADMRFYSVIYDLVDDVTSAMEGRLSPILKEVTLGRATVRELFRISKIGLVAGCMVLDGLIQKSNHVRLLRDEVVVYVGTIHALKRYKDDVREVREGTECGISLDKFTDLRVGDLLEAFSREEVRATISS
ncbi:MAG: translation initiation factor IF-2 [Magnetococcales bacterium]|nr:translation initiation factor IF-2 [Magnetococcales bacterium]